MAQKFPPAYWLAQEIASAVIKIFISRNWMETHNLPREGAFIAVSNHVTELDAVTFMQILVDNHIPVKVMAKDALFKIPVLGWLMRSSGMIPVARGTKDASKALEISEEILQAGGCVGIFPEGTLTRDPGLWPMKARSGAARLALKTQVPVIPIAQWGVQEILEPYGSKFNLRPCKTVNLVVGTPVELSDLYGREDHEACEEASRRIMADIRSLVEQLRGQSAPEKIWDMHTDPDRYAARLAARKARRKAKKTAKAAKKAARKLRKENKNNLREQTSQNEEFPPA